MRLRRRRDDAAQERPAEDLARSPLLRRIDIGPRLLILTAIPIIALLTVIGLLIGDDLERWQELRRHQAASQDAGTLVELRAALQEERHRVIGHDATPVFPDEVSVDPTSTLATTMQEARSTLDGVQVISEARRLATTGQAVSAALAYDMVIDELMWMIEQRLEAAPLGPAAEQSAALIALLHGQEAFLQEDLHAQIGAGNPQTLVRLRTEALSALEQFNTAATPQSRDRLEVLTVSPSWRYLTVTEIDAFARLDSEAERILWSTAADVRRLGLLEAALMETLTLQTSANEQVDIELARVLSLAGIVGGIVAIALLGAIALRRSIVRPLSALTVNARSMSKGQIAPMDDPASDEIAEVGGAFSSLADTMNHLFSDIDAVSRSIRDGDYDQRIDTDPLQGDWARLATTMNATLELSAQHHVATREELDRRAVLTEISSAAVLSDSGPAITASVLHQLPRAVPSSRAHLHEHPSGPPLIDLGVPLEPSMSALEIPSLGEQAQRVTIGDRHGIASLVEFPDGPPAVLALMFGETEPAQLEPLIGLVETAARILAQAHRRQVAETSATHTREHDLLTGLANATHLERWFENADDGVAWMAVGVTPQDLGDLDGSFGREARNLVLNVVGDRLQQILTSIADAAGIPEMLARTEEPEFVAIVPLAFGEQLANAFAREFAEPLEIGGVALTVGLTIGLDELPADRLDSGRLTETLANLATAIRRADGRTTEIIPFEAQYREDVRRRTQLIRWLERAIEDRELTINFQPIVNAATTEIEGYECLIRGSLDGKPVSPAEFIPLAEDTNMIVAIGEFTLREACAALPFLRGHSPYVAVNLSPIELSDPHLLDRIDSVLSNLAVDRERVVFEITEGAATTAADVELLKRLRRLGVKIAIDDFGTGQANLSYLNTLPAQILKLDRSLVTPMVNEPGAAAVVRKTIEMAHDLGMTVVGEGVETNDELNALRRMRCDRIQGWLTGRPAPLEQFIEITVDRPITQISQPQDQK